jgi:retron-type reverse transcriptase
MNEHSILDTMPFGKYKGELVGTVIEENSNYIFWALNNTSFRLDNDAQKYFKEISKEHSLNKARSLYSLKLRSILGGK